MAIIPQLKKQNKRPPRKTDGVTWHEEVTWPPSMFPPWFCQLSDELQWQTHIQDASSGTRLRGWLERKEPRFRAHPARLTSFPFYSCHPSSSDSGLEEGGAGRRGQGRHFSSWPREKRDTDAAQAWSSNTGKAGGEGCSRGHGDPVRCHVCRVWSWNVASCLSNSISIQGDKLAYSLTNSVHFFQQSVSWK